MIEESSSGGVDYEDFETKLKVKYEAVRNTYHNQSLFSIIQTVHECSSVRLVQPLT